MVDEYTIGSVQEPGPTEWQVIGGGLTRYNTSQAGEGPCQRLCFVLRAPDQQVVGGVIGEIDWNWLCVELLWIPEELRGRGYGHRLLEAIEEAARERGATNVHLDTFSFQAPDFYKQHGYRVFGQLDDFPPGHQRFFFTKAL